MHVTETSLRTTSARRLWMMPALAMLAGLLMPAHAAAAHAYVWKKANDGVWNRKANWNCIAASVDDVPCANALGFPNARLDEALFIDAYTALQRITVLGTVRVGRMVFGPSNFDIGLVANNLQSQIITDTGDPAVPTEIIADTAATFAVPIVNEGPIVVKPGANVTVVFESDIGPFAFDLTIDGIGTVELRHHLTLTGRTTVLSGLLDLESQDPEPTLAGFALQVGDALGGRLTARAVITRPNQIADAMPVVVQADGHLIVDANERVGNLAIVRGLTAVRKGSRFDMNALTLVGGNLEARNGSVLRLHGDVRASGDSVITAGASLGSVLFLDGTRTFDVAETTTLQMLEIEIAGVGLNDGVIKTGPGILVFSQTNNVNNSYTGVTDVQAGTLSLVGTNGLVAVRGNLHMGGGPSVAQLNQLTVDSIQSAKIAIDKNGVLLAKASQTFPRVDVSSGGFLVVQGTPASPVTLSVDALTIVGSEVEVLRDATLRLTGTLISRSTDATAFITTDSNGSDGGRIAIASQADLPVVVDGPLPIDLIIDVPIVGAKGLIKQGPGAAQLSKINPLTGNTTIVDGLLIVDGTQTTSPVTLAGGVLGGTGSVGPVASALKGSGRLAPGFGAGRLTAKGLALFTGTTVSMELNGLTPGTTYDQIDVRGPVSLGNATLSLVPSSSLVPTATTQFVLILNDGTDPVVGTFAGLPEGAKVTLRGRTFTLSYRGGDGNDVTLRAQADDPSKPPTDPDPTDPSDVTYFLSEGATGSFFDEDVLIANPTNTVAPVTLTFAKENGEQVVATRVVPAQAHLTVHVDQIPGLEDTAAAVRVRSDARVPLVVERSVFWDASYYAGHTGGAIDSPAPDWFFAEGSQGFFDTFVLVINPNATPVEATFTFVLESGPPVVKTVTIGATTRLTLNAGDVRELVGQSFGISVHATQPIMAERSMYFGRTATRVWSGGTESAGVTTPSTHWFLAEGATGGFFTTFVLLSNPQATDAHVTLQYLLDTGETVTVPKTIAAHARLTTNIAAEDDPRLRDAAMSTVVTADVPIIAERSMYWLGAATPWGEGHNSFGVVEAGTRWGLAEGRTGGPLHFHTYILLANPQSTAAEVTVTYLRESGAPIVQTYTVPPTSRFNIDVNGIAGLEAAAFGAQIAVTNGVPIVVERSLYWDSNGVVFSGGTNATGIPLLALQ